MKPITALLVAVSLFAGARYANADDYPTRPIRVLTANSVGGTSDIFVQLLPRCFNSVSENPSLSIIVLAAA